MKVLLIVLGSLLVVVSLLLTIVNPLALIGVAFGVVLIIYGKKYKKPEKQTAARQANENASERPVYMFAVAGVTFKNDDGSSRQYILKKIEQSDDYSDSTACLEKYTYEGRPAISVSTVYGCVGNIRHNDVNTVLPLIEGDYIARIYAEHFEDENDKTIYRADVNITPLGGNV